jgi:hypothetical protein
MLMNSQPVVSAVTVDAEEEELDPEKVGSMAVRLSCMSLAAVITPPLVTQLCIPRVRRARRRDGSEKRGAGNTCGGSKTCVR